MTTWCFRCRRAVEPEGDRCPTCGSMLGTIITGEGRQPSVRRIASFISEDELSVMLSRELGIPEINLDEFELSPEIIGLLDADFAISNSVVPVNRAGATVIVAVTNRYYGLKEHP